MNLFKVLFISWALGFGLSHLKDLNVDYVVKCMSMSLIYFYSSLFCYRYILIELKCKNYLNVYLVSLLCICMIISSWFNAIFSSHYIYYLLIDIRSGDGFSWKNIYRSVELISLLTVGRNGFIYLVRRLSCGNRWFNVIIKNNFNINHRK